MNALPQKYTLKLTGKFESRFGLALANLGDINKDICDDIAIGAPYEGNGVVYIYLGNPDGLSKEPSQIISASDLGFYPNLNTFGSSLSGGVDLDGNSYPDLTIGAYNSSAVVTLLSRPIIDIQTEYKSNELNNIDPTKSGCISNPTTNLTCFSFKTCCLIHPYENNQIKTLRLTYTVIAETFNNLKKFSRVFFEYDSKRSNLIKKEISIQTDGIMNCQEEVVYLKENTGDIQTPIKFRFNYTLIESELKSSGLIALNPILDQIQANRQFIATFQKDCGDDDLCESRMILKANFELDKDLIGKIFFFF